MAEKRKRKLCMGSSVARYAIAVLLTGLVAGCSNPVQETNTKLTSETKPSLSAPIDAIKIGDEISAARKILDQHGKSNHVGGFALVKLADDIENIFVDLDPNHMHGCVWYSKSTGQITQMSVVCFPNRKAGRLYHVWLPVKAIEFNQDGSHSVTFTKPLTKAEFDARSKKEALERPKASFPTFRAKQGDNG